MAEILADVRLNAYYDADARYAIVPIPTPVEQCGGGVFARRGFCGPMRRTICGGCHGSRFFMV